MTDLPFTADARDRLSVAQGGIGRRGQVLEDPLRKLYA
jgi:hypothetical protein